MKIRTIFVLLATSVSSQAVDYLWNVPSGDWSVGSNWNPAGPPGGGGGNHAIINNGGTADLTGPSNPLHDTIIASGIGTSGTVNHSAGLLNSAGWVFVGRNGGNGTYNMTGSSSLNTGDLNVGGQRDAPVGSQAGTTGVFTMDTSGTVALAGALWIGSRGGSGSATVTNGTLTTTQIRVGDNDGQVSAGSGSLTINGGTITSANQFQVGRHGGVGTVNQTGGTVNVNAGWFGVANDNAGSAGSSYTLSGGALNLNNTVNTEVGADTAGSFTMSGASTTMTTNQLFVGHRVNGNGTFTMSGGTLTLRAGESRIGNAGGATGVMNFSNGIINATGTLQVGGTGNGTLNMTGGVINNNGWLAVGRFAGGVGVANISSGQILHTNNATSMLIGENGTGTVNLSGDALISINSTQGVRIGHAATGNGTLNLNGGTFAARFFQKSVAESLAKINFNGGTVRALAGSADFFPGFGPSNLEVQAGGAIFDTNGNDITITQALNGAGGLTKQGTGRLTLNGISTYAGLTRVVDGTLTLTGGSALAGGGGVTVAPGATLDGNGSATGPATIDGTLSPGSSIGTLTFGGPVTLNGTTFMEIDRTGAPAADLVIAAGAIDYGGDLDVILLGGTPQLGDNFNLFDAPSFLDVFATIDLPALPGDYSWQNNLSVDGSLSVVPEASSISLAGLAALGLLARRRRA